MIQRDDIINVIFSAMEDLNTQLPQDKKIDKRLDVQLFGGQGNLTSLSLVRFIVAVEDRMSETFEKSVVLADERALSKEHSPFRSVAALVDYIENLLSENVDA
ncbi:MAG: hypothetical protein AABY34_00525 [Pseudomonadota bacterium]